LFLHRLGYNFFTLPKLTYSEISFLVDAWNREQETKERNSKKRSKKR